MSTGGKPGHHFDCSSFAYTVLNRTCHSNKRFIRGVPQVFFGKLCQLFIGNDCWPKAKWGCVNKGPPPPSRTRPGCNQAKWGCVSKQPPAVVHQQSKSSHWLVRQLRQR